MRRSRSDPSEMLRVGFYCGNSGDPSSGLFDKKSEELSKFLRAMSESTITILKDNVRRWKNVQVEAPQITRSEGAFHSLLLKF